MDTVAGTPLVKVKCYLRDQGIDVDVFLAETPFQQEILSRRRLVDTPDGQVWLASPEDVVLLKLLAHRPRDISDVTDVLFAQGALDKDYLREWAAKLGVSERLDQAFQAYDEMT